MPDSVPPWLATMREISDTHWAPGDGTNATILEWLRVIGSDYPDMAAYCASAMPEPYFSWCGLTVGYCMAKAGIPPVFGGGDTSRFLWAAAWLGWGTPVSTPQLGDVLVFDFGGGDHHVTLFETDNGNGTWACRGGNQSHNVMVTNFPKSKVIGIRRPVAGAAVPRDTVSTPLAPPVLRPASQRFADCVALVLHDEGGNDDDPRDPGGRTSRGILQREWDVWRQTHPGLPADVWQAPQDQVLAIYHEKYWSPLNCDSLPAGVDYTVFDYGVLSGTGRVACILQGFVGVHVDGEIGPETIAATQRADAATLIEQICDERLAFLQGLSTFPTFGRGWTRRVEGVRNASLAMVSAAVAAVAPAMHAAARPQPATPRLPGPQSGPQPATAQPSTLQLAPAPPVLSPDEIKAAIQDTLQKLAENQAARAHAPQAGATAAPSLDISTLSQLLGALRQFGVLPSMPAADGNAAPILSPIDKALGGQAMVGLKTPLAILAYAVLWIMQAAGAVGPTTAIGADKASTAAQVITAVIAALGGLGVTAKIDRGTQALAALAAAAQKLQPPAPPAPGKS